MKAFFRSIREKYLSIIEKQGYPIVVTICVCVITASALWTKQSVVSPLATPPPVMQDISAAQLMQQSLLTAASPSPAPTEMPPGYFPPLTEYTLLTPFSAYTMRRSGITGIWAIHDAGDLQASLGSQVLAIADGFVIASGQDELQGSWMRIDHGDGIEALYAGMASVSSVTADDQVHFGDVIGYVGKGTLAESDLPPHLHLRVTRNGIAVDPLKLWE